MNSRYVWNPEYLSIYFETAESMLREGFLFQAEKREVREIAEHGLKPTMLREDLAYARMFKLVNVEREHCDVLRRTGRGDRVKNRLREIFTEVNARFLELQNLGD